MIKTDNITVCYKKGAALDYAKAVAKRVGVELSESPGEALTLLIDANGVSLTGYGLTYRGDFEDMLPRLTNGRLQHEMLVHITKTDTEHPKAVDATAGMGNDAVLLAAAGYEVTMFERNPVIAALLKDAIRRAKKNVILRDIVSRMTLVEDDSTEYLKKLENTELIYLDPMFPARQKSGLINKKLQLIQHLEQPCTDEEALLSAALSSNARKIVIKRPLKGAVLAGHEPQYSVNGKAIRYDCFVLSR